MNAQEARAKTLAALERRRCRFSILAGALCALGSWLSLWSAADARKPWLFAAFAVLLVWSTRSTWQSVKRWRARYGKEHR